MDSNIVSAIIGAFATVIAVVVAWLLQTSNNKKSAPKKLTTKPKGTTESPANTFSRRYLDNPSHYRFIKALPVMRKAVMENAREGWDTGITTDMRQASYDVIDFLEYAWLVIARFYPDKHWANQDAESYIRQYITDRFTFHWSKHEPNGPGSGGTIVGVQAGGDVISDLENLITDTVSALSIQGDFDFLAWKDEWLNKSSS
ncbi:hypothetical protein BGP77_12015 [Saccharospirillum sp. MSK14-1]|uniref:hypothetical protein n=1 Tax=Saccharospirillum sp. MSK14-1 TaxID=1897632 RepID=UPI000D3A443E|nr:hypothetical protein [Saccharospirillum sp. MSK14-1]PTY38430.1 hypothetical protein BGP77_12015 [Saccharospirillum sp. MSK14-1]